VRVRRTRRRCSRRTDERKDLCRHEQGRITYSADIELNGRELPGSIYLPEYISEQLKGLVARIYSKVKALYYVNDPGAADALADDIARDAADLIALARALAGIVKGRKVH